MAFKRFHITNSGSSAIYTSLFIFWFLPVLGASKTSNDTLNTKKVTNTEFAKYLDLRIENGVMLKKGGRGAELMNSSYYNGADIRFGLRKLNPADTYSNLYRHPYMGLGWYISTFHNNAVGNPSAAYVYFTIPFSYEKERKFSFAYSGAIGLAFNFNPYDSIKNPDNILIGSNLNAYIHLGLLANYKIGNRFAVNGTVGLKHFSNGSAKLPNYGLNLLPFTLGVSYRISDEQVEQFKKPIPQFKKYNLVNLSLSVGAKNYIPHYPSHLKASCSLQFLRQFSYKYRGGIGFDLFYSSPSETWKFDVPNSFNDYFSYAVTGNWEWVLTPKIYIPAGIGIYLHRNIENLEKTGYYERLGVRYMVSNHIHAGFTIKAHKDVADYVEWTLGYTFHNNHNQY